VPFPRFESVPVLLGPRTFHRFLTDGLQDPGRASGTMAAGHAADLVNGLS